MDKLVEELEQNIGNTKKVNPIFSNNPYTPLIQHKEVSKEPINEENNSKGSGKLKRTKSIARYNNFNIDN